MLYLWEYTCKYAAGQLMNYPLQSTSFYVLLCDDSAASLCKNETKNLSQFPIAMWISAFQT